MTEFIFHFPGVSRDRLCLRNTFNFWFVHGIMNTSSLEQSRDPMCSCFHEQTKIEFITCIYILYYQSSINFQFSPNLAGFQDILN